MLARRQERVVCGHTRPSPSAPPATGLNCSSSQGRLLSLLVLLSFLGQDTELASFTPARVAPPGPLPPSSPRFHALSETAPVSPILASWILPLRVLPPLSFLRLKEWGSLLKLFRPDFCKKRESGSGRGWPRHESSARCPGTVTWSGHPAWTPIPLGQPDHNKGQGEDYGR